MTPLERDTLRRIRQQIHAILAESGSTDDQLTTAGHMPSFSQQCTKCGRPIHWFQTRNGKNVALDDRPGPYVISEDGTAVFEGLGGHAYHYDGTAEGCPAQVTEQRTNRPRVEWQDIYD